MKTLLTLRESDVISGANNIEPVGFTERQAARAVLFNEVGQIALLHASKHHYHKLPGGGVDADEDMQQALQRELMEEVGCRAEVLAEIGEVVEYRDQWQLKQVSHCYLAKLVGGQGSPNFTEEEIADGFEIVWADDIDEAIKLVEQSRPANYDGWFIQPRDLALLKAAKNLL